MYNPSADRPDEATRGEMLSHILAEYAAGAKAGGFTGGYFSGTYHDAHWGAGMEAENAFRLGLGQSPIRDPVPPLFGNVTKFTYVYQSGAVEAIYFSGGDIIKTSYSKGWFGALFF